MNRKMRRLIQRAERHKKPRPEGDASALLSRLNQNNPLSTEEIKILDAQVLRAITAFSTGNATKSHWINLVDANNLCQQFDKMGIDSGHLSDLEAADTALRAAHERHSSGKNLAFDGIGLQAIKTMADVHLAMLQQCTRGAWDKALKNLIVDIAETPTGDLLGMKENDKTGAPA
jgi:predicted metal-dependent phosphotriesterase family hydrolase